MKHAPGVARQGDWESLFARMHMMDKDIRTAWECLAGCSARVGCDMNARKHTNNARGKWGRGSRDVWMQAQRNTAIAANLRELGYGG